MTTAPADRYENPLPERYASPEMVHLFSAEKKFRTWRQVWIALAEAERDLGLPISEAQIAELAAHAEDVDVARAAELERETRHDVMAHIRAYGEQCPTARKIIHLGATSALVTDNTDLLLLRAGLDLLATRVVNTLDALATLAARTRALPTLAFTHFQPAQLTTVGKRACLWAQDLLADLDEIELRAGRLRALGAKGATGTQASFLALFAGDAAKVVELDRRFAARLGFADSFIVTGQTYPRKVDAQVFTALSGIAQSAGKFSSDLRLLQHLREAEEPFEADQVGSSAMAYKRNPVRAERMAALGRFVLTLALNPALTASTQWFERTLDDSANRRLAIPEGFLAADAILLLYQNIAEGLTLYPRVIERHVLQEMPFLATEDLLMAAVKAGGDRQALHEVIRRHSMAAALAQRESGENDLLARLRAEPALAAAQGALAAALEPARYIGRSPEQVDEFLARELRPRLAANAARLGRRADLRV
ncbi:MAG: adenylosuccinate lyase [Planctomycetes bacterium]|nr:adenylosuccinate lyase [Planctomycetota bacterium]